MTNEEWGRGGLGGPAPGRERTWLPVRAGLWVVCREGTLLSPRALCQGWGGAGLGWGLSLRPTPCRPDHHEAVLLERGAAAGLHEQGPVPHPPRLAAQVRLP